MRLLTAIAFLLALPTIGATQDSFPNPGTFVDSTEVVITFVTGGEVYDLKCFKKEIGKWEYIILDGTRCLQKQVDSTEFYRWDNFGKHLFAEDRILRHRAFIPRNQRR